MIYLAVENIENELKNEISRLNMVIEQNESQMKHVEQQNQNNEETVITVPPQIIKIG
jgi:hypothetical protein